MVAPQSKPRRGDRSLHSFGVLSPLRGSGLGDAPQNPGLAPWATLCRTSGAETQAVRLLQSPVESSVAHLADSGWEVVLAVRVVGRQLLAGAEQVIDGPGGGDAIPDAGHLEVVVMEWRTRQKCPRCERLPTRSPQGGLR